MAHRFFRARALSLAILLGVSAPLELSADTRLISVKSSGETQSREPSRELVTPQTSGRVLSSDGRYLLVTSGATNLVAESAPGGDLSTYRYDSVNDLVERVTTSSSGQAFSGSAASVSATGQHIVFLGFPSEVADGPRLSPRQAYVKDMNTGAVSLVSRSTAGEMANEQVNNPVISADARYVVFDSHATNLIANDQNSERDVFLHDRQTGSTTRVSQNAAGAGGNAVSDQPSIGTGNLIAFLSSATNLSSTENNGNAQVLVSTPGSTELQMISVGQAGVAGNADSLAPVVAAGNNHVLFSSSATNFVVAEGGGARQAYVRNLTTNVTTLASRTADNVAANGAVFGRSISGDGALVTFDTRAFNLFADDDAFTEDSFVATIATNVVERISVAGERIESADLSSDGLVTAINYQPAPVDSNSFGRRRLRLRTATNDLEVRANTHISRSGNGFSQLVEDGAVSDDGRFILLWSAATDLVENDTNSLTDLFLYDELEDRLTLVSRGVGGNAADGRSVFGRLSGNGDFVVFSSDATNLVAGDTNDLSDVFLFTRATGAIERVSLDGNGSEIDGSSQDGAVSEDGRFIAFRSSANVLGAQDFLEFSTGIYLRDRLTGDVILANRRADGGFPLGFSGGLSMSASGRFLAFTSESDGLDGAEVEEDQAFVFDQETGKVRRVSVAADGSSANEIVGRSMLSRDGRHLSFFTFADNLLPEDSDSNGDVYLADLSTGALELISVGTDGSNADLTAFGVSMSSDASQMAFVSGAANLDPRVGDFLEGVFVRDREAGTTTLVSLNNEGEMANRYIEQGWLSGDGTTIAFDTEANNFVGKTNSTFDVYRRKLARTAPTLSVVSSLLPSSRSATVDTPVTVFATIIGSTDLQSCRLGLDEAVGVRMQYRTTDSSNVVTGSPNATVDLLAGVPQSFVLALTADAPVSTRELPLSVRCVGSRAADTVTGVNTLLFTATPTASADIVALAATTSGDGILDLPDDGDFGAFAVAAINVGIGDAFVVRPTVQGQGLTELLVCPTDATTGECLSSPATSASLAIAGGGTPTFAIFARNVGPVPFDPAVNRLSLEFEDSGGTVRGRTSVALQ